MLSKYERGVSVPSSGVLLKLSDALGVRTEYFFRTAEISLERVQHRNKHRWKLPKLAETKVLADVRDQLERWQDLDSVVPAPWSVRFSLPEDLPSPVASLDEVENVAIRVREHWDLGLNPIPDLIDTLEARGLKVFTTRFDDSRFEGMSARTDHHHVVVVGRNWPGDRQRFTHLFEQTVYRALSEDLISESKAAELLSISVWSLAASRRMEPVDGHSGR